MTKRIKGKRNCKINEISKSQNHQNKLGDFIKTIHYLNRNVFMAIADLFDCQKVRFFMIWSETFQRCPVLTIPSFLCMNYKSCWVEQIDISCLKIQGITDTILYLTIIFTFLFDTWEQSSFITGMGEKSKIRSHLLDFENAKNSNEGWKLVHFKENIGVI